MRTAVVVLALGGCVLAGCGTGTGGGVPSAGTTSTTAATSPAPTTVSVGSALATATTAEQDARAAYEAVIGKFGVVEPFPAIAAQETRHIEILDHLAARHGVALPTGPITATAPPATIKAACQLGARTEAHLVSLYARLIAEVPVHPDLVKAFGDLRAAARVHALPAFERCA
ncbi:MAG: DUF2202 domain-containing protein [Actinomycetota bacterium]|nr:DUF2202 domain-containing protein [Actinomycetota bacterium]